MFIKPDFLNAVKVQFLKPICEEDFVERGMKAWLVAVEWDEGHECFDLFFNFDEFDAENDKYFRETYHPNRHTAAIDPESRRKLYTAKEAGMYTARLSTYLSVKGLNNATRQSMTTGEINAKFARELANCVVDISERT